MNSQQKNRPHESTMIFSSRWVMMILLMSTSSILLLIVGVFIPYIGPAAITTTIDYSGSEWKDYRLEEALKRVAGKKDKTVIVCTVSEPYWPLLNNWLISVKRQKHHDKVLVIAEDYATLFKVNERWPGHAVLIPPVPDSQSAHNYGSQGFYNFTSRRPRHLLKILELGYSVMYNDVDLVWVEDPFPYFQENHDIYFSDDTDQVLIFYSSSTFIFISFKLALLNLLLLMQVKPLNHAHNLPPPGRDKRTNICSCIIYLHPTVGAKLVISKWIEEILDEHWTSNNKANDQPAFNFALMKTIKQVDMYLLPQVAFPTGGVFFLNKTWAQQNKGKQAIIHNNYIVGFQNKIKRFQEYGLWLIHDHLIESPIGDLSSP
ncbi:UDP-D-xylose:L-fucose alpha-1,3-D-xylosyltransferase MGP4-like [Impatiens glandulifera]|uniref:UDP-D-xylose:L-fucose alpha-1,3-D-xylosyltransferase MGP4-like n=1 Tax=Impatiens glandulifera TaxID=253017 RepID=UPI001FB0D3EF|nr:UDP-D-xylose:L-fucose alpha-1,3-D-xylosyltransferase MGP4-like [Impatiens glandulifera]